MQLFSRILPITCLLAVSLQPVMADGIYVEGNVGIDQPDLFSFTAAEDVNIPTLGLRSGYEFNDVWAIEGDLSIGLTDDTAALPTIEEEAEIGLTGTLGIFVRASAPLGDRASLHLRIGAVASEYESEIVDVGARNFVEQYSGAAFGLGGTFDLSEDLYLRTDYTHIESPGDDSGTLSFGAGMKF